MADPILEAKVRVPERVMRRAFAGDVVLLNLDTGQYHGLNDTGARLLDLVEEHAGSVRAAADGLAAETGAPRGDVAADTAEFFASLAERGLVEVDAAA